MIGKILSNRYEILEEIGNGGMARVFKARCRLLNRFVAIKVLRSEFAKDSEFLARFNTEAQAAAALSHQNIVSIYDVGREGDIEYIVMEYVEGQTLKEYIKENVMLPWQEAVEFTIQICKALSCAHKNGIVHRDIKPQNIILTPDGVLKVTDFGIARAATASSVTITGNTMGSVHYLSPEQARGGYTDAKSDIYSLGIVMYEMVTGRLPFEGDNAVSIAIRQIQEKPVSPKEFNLAVPLAVENIILKAMNKDQTMRYQSANDMLVDLKVARVKPDIAIAEQASDDIDATKKIPIVKIEPDPPAERIERKITPHSKEGENMNKAEKKAVIWAVVTSVIIVAALVVGAIAVLFPDAFGKKSGEIEVPKLVGEIYEDIKDSYKEQNITITVAQTVNDSEYKEGEIISQNPKAGKIVKNLTEIEVVVSLGVKEYKLENYERKGFIEVKLALEDKGIIVKEEREESDTIAEGVIIRSSPGANSKVKSGDTVTLYVSSGAGEKTVPMPNLIGLNVQLAKKIITDNDLLEGEIKEAPSDKAKGTVIEQSEAANTKVKTYTAINLTVSNGMEIKEKSVAIIVPQEKESTLIKIVQDGVVIHDAVHNKAEGAFDITVSGIGTVTLQLYYDGVLSNTMKVNL